MWVAEVSLLREMMWSSRGRNGELEVLLEGFMEKEERVIRPCHFVNVESFGDL